jgi:hypothetical protein
MALDASSIGCVRGRKAGCDHRPRFDALSSIGPPLRRPAVAARAGQRSAAGRTPRTPAGGPHLTAAARGNRGSRHPPPAEPRRGGRSRLLPRRPRLARGVRDRGDGHARRGGRARARGTAARDRGAPRGRCARSSAPRRRPQGDTCGAERSRDRGAGRAPARPMRNAAPGGQRLGLYELTRPEVDAHFAGRFDFG